MTALSGGCMPGNGESTTIYSTLTAPAKEIHQSFEQAVEQVKMDSGGNHPIWIDGKAISDRDTFENRSPAHTDLPIGKFKQAIREDAKVAINGVHNAFCGWSLSRPFDRQEQGSEYVVL